MSILIKGIDMPKEKDEALLLLILGDGTVAEKIGSDRYEEMIGTKAIQIPTPHGRLVDANDIKAKCINEVFESMGTVAITDPYPDDEWADDICDVPTILETEGRNELQFMEMDRGM